MILFITHLGTRSLRCKSRCSIDGVQNTNEMNAVHTELVVRCLHYMYTSLIKPSESVSSSAWQELDTLVHVHVQYAPTKLIMGRL